LKSLIGKPKVEKSLYHKRIEKQKQETKPFKQTLEETLEKNNIMGMEAKYALEITTIVLDEYAKHLEKTEPYATNTIRIMKLARDMLPDLDWDCGQT